MIAADPAYLEIILGIIKKHIPNCKVLAIGSRVRWTHSETSDLDLVIVGDKKLEFGLLGEIREDLMESDVPFRIDVLDYRAVSESFRGIIDRENVILYNTLSEPSEGV